LEARYCVQPPLPPQPKPILTSLPPTHWPPAHSATPKVARLLWHGIAESTRASYTAAWNSFERHSLLNGHPALPATFLSLASWIADTLDSGRAKPETVETYLIGIKNHHIENGAPTTVFEDPRIKRLLRGALRIFGAKPIRPRDEIERPLLTSMLRTLDLNRHDHVNLRAAFTVAFAAFLRSGELTWDTWDHNSHHLHLSRGSVQFIKNGAILLLPRSKTDPFGKGTPIVLSPAPDEACPIRALKTLFSRYPTANTTPLFNRLAGPFNQSWFVASLKDAILASGHDPSHFSGHSFRRGAANSAVAAGLSKDELKELGRWKSDAVNRYLTSESSTQLRLAANRKLHNHLAPSPRRTSLVPAPTSSSSTPPSSRGRFVSRD
jgi:hypothetical protein